MTFFYPMAEYLRPAKLLTLAAGLAFLIAGALFSGLPDWDIPVSLLMGVCAYFTAAPVLRVIMEGRWQYSFYAAFWTWITVDATYALYWGMVNPTMVFELRTANAFASLALFLAAGLVWYYQTPTSSVPRAPSP